MDLSRCCLFPPPGGSPPPLQAPAILQTLTLSFPYLEIFADLQLPNTVTLFLSLWSYFFFFFKNKLCLGILSFVKFNGLASSFCNWSSSVLRHVPYASVLAVASAWNGMNTYSPPVFFRLLGLLGLAGVCPPCAPVKCSATPASAHMSVSSTGSKLLESRTKTC